MKTCGFTVFALLSILALAGIGCSKTESSAGTTSGSASASAASTGAASACADRLASMKPGASADDKKNFAAACGAVSAKTQACIAAAKADKDMDACLTDKTEKEAVTAVILGAALKAGTASAGATSTTKLPKVGLQIDVPGEAMVSDGIGPNSQMVNTVAIGGITISEASGSTPKTLKAAKADAQMFKPRNVQGDQTADGYWLTFENTGSMGTNYWVKTVHTFGKKSYVCEGSPDTADKEAAALAACKTLRQ